MDFFEVISKRRSIRKYSDTPVPDQVIEKALDAAIWAPNSSNVQTWDFYWVKDQEKYQSLIAACLSQAAARSAKHLIVVTADPKNWKRSQTALLDWAAGEKAPKLVMTYYEKIVPMTYRWGLFNSIGLIKWLTTNIIGLFRPMARSTNFRRDLEATCIKSAALAAENFVLAITAQGFDTCMMEGFDEWRVKRLLKLSRTSRVVMVIAVGKSTDKGTWGKPFRLPKETVVHIV